MRLQCATETTLLHKHPARLRPGHLRASRLFCRAGRRPILTSGGGRMDCCALPEPSARGRIFKPACSSTCPSRAPSPRGAASCEPTPLQKAHGGSLFLLPCPFAPPIRHMQRSHPLSSLQALGAYRATVPAALQAEVPPSQARLFLGCLASPHAFLLGSVLLGCRRCRFPHSGPSSASASALG